MPHAILVFRTGGREQLVVPMRVMQVPRLAMPPQPFKPNTWHLQANEPVTEVLHNTLTEMLGQMNKAIALLPGKQYRLRVGRHWF
jgi:hypothetical protein